MTRRQTRDKALRAKAEQVTRENLSALDRVHQQRVADGVCRHCGGGLPCWSFFGDATPGVQHTTATFRKSSRERERRQEPGHREHPRDRK